MTAASPPEKELSFNESGKGGGIVAYTSTKVGAATKEWQKELYNALIKHTGLKGNRSEPLKTANLAECRQTSMPAVLLELGFMDSSTDVPIILTEDFANKCAEAIVEVLVKKGNLQKPAKLHKVQVGAFADLAKAEELRDELKAKGFEAVIV